MRDFAFITRPARGPLAACVESLWYARGVSEHVDVIFPTAQISLLINLGDPQRITPDNAATVTGTEAWIIGQQQRVMTNAPVGRSHIVGATFKTVGAAQVLGVPCAELTGQVVDLEAIWGPLAREARERIGERAEPASALTTLERVLSARISPEPRLRRTQLAVHALTSARPLTVGQVCALVELSNRSLIADLRRLVGLRPKELARQARLSRVLNDLAVGTPSSLSSLALTHGYCDQAHLNREFRGFSGISPTEYLRRRQSAYGDTTSTPNFVTG